MAKYIKAVDAADKFSEISGTPLCELVDIMCAIHAADVAQVVHCGDCKFRCDFTDGHCECRRWPNIPMSYQRVDPQFDFCSYGERKDGAE